MARRPRHQPGKIDRLDPEIRELIAQLRIDHGWTIDEILKKLRELGQADISRSGLGRHVKSLEDIGAQLRHSREVARALVEQAGGMPESKQAQLNIELMHSMILRLLTATNDEGDGQPITFGPEDSMFLARSLQSLASAQKTDVDRIAKLEQAAAEKAKKTAADTAAKTARERGMTNETADAIYHAVLGSEAA